MKKTLLATAIAGALGVTAAAQAATVYDQDGTRVDIYGRIAMGIEGGGSEVGGRDNGAEFVDAFSRLGVRLQHMVSSDLTAFGHIEWRFRADENGTRFDNDEDSPDGEFDAFSETRQAYFGLRSNTWGTIQAGNFDSFYKDAVTSPFDVWINYGLEFAGHPYQSRGDSIGYITPNLSGFQAYLQAKHYSERGEVAASERDEEIVTQGGVVYETGGLRLAAGYVDDKAIVGRFDEGAPTAVQGIVDGTGNDEVLYGATASYQFTPEFSARIGYEGRDQNDDISASNGFDKWGLGLSYAVNEWTFHANVYDVDADGDGEDRTPWAAGAYYNISSNFDVFLELYERDAEDHDLYYLTGARYFF